MHTPTNNAVKFFIHSMSHRNHITHLIIHSQSVLNYCYNPNYVCIKTSNEKVTLKRYAKSDKDYRYITDKLTNCPNF